MKANRYTLVSLFFSLVFTAEPILLRLKASPGGNPFFFQPVKNPFMGHPILNEFTIVPT